MAVTTTLLRIGAYAGAANDRRAWSNEVTTVISP